MPVFVVFQPGGAAYGLGFDPIVVKWNFQERHHVVPYFEISAGVLSTTHQVPIGAGSFNFTPGAAFGVHVLRGKHYWSAEFRYLHISDAQITSYNPGTDTLGLRIGFGRFTRPRE